MWAYLDLINSKIIKLRPNTLRWDRWYTVDKPKFDQFKLKTLPCIRPGPLCHPGQPAILFLNVNCVFYH